MVPHFRRKICLSPSAHLATGHRLEGNPLTAANRLLLEKLQLSLNLQLLQLLWTSLHKFIMRYALDVGELGISGTLKNQPTVIGAPLPPTALSCPEARLTPASEAPAMVTGKVEF